MFLRIVDILSELFQQYGIVLFEFYFPTFHAENVLCVICNSTYIVVHHWRSYNDWQMKNNYKSCGFYILRKFQVLYLVTFNWYRSQSFFYKMKTNYQCYECIKYSTFISISLRHVTWFSIFIILYCESVSVFLYCTPVLLLV